MTDLDFRQMPKWMSDSLLIMTSIGDWAKRFDVDEDEIRRQIGLAYGWTINNPRKAPKKNVMRYLYNWMLIAQRKGSMAKRSVKPKEKYPDPESDMSLEEMRAIRQKNFPQYKADPCRFNNIVDTQAVNAQDKKGEPDEQNR
jgi:hypothetical protein